MKSIMQTSICRMCFKDIKNNGLSTFIHNDDFLCPECFNKFNLNISRFKIAGIYGWGLFNYDETIRKSLYQLKGCFDIEIAPIFLYRISLELRAKYSDYYIVPMPSWKDDDEKRGFNHVIEIFRVLHLPILPILYKKQNIKQALQKRWNRCEMIENIGIISESICTNKKILLVDDVMTSGSTLLGAIKVVTKCKPRDVKILVLARNNKEKEERMK